MNAPLWRPSAKRIAQTNITGFIKSGDVGLGYAFWGEGLTASEIGRRLNVSKNAVVGKVHRLGLPKRQSPILKKTKEVSILGMENLRAGMCSWPDGDPGTEKFGFCGHSTLPDKPYCAEHCAKAYIVSSKNKKTAKAA